MMQCVFTKQDEEAARSRLYCNGAPAINSAEASISVMSYSVRR